jgi:Family of unknown function (DUF6527)
MKFFKYIGTWFAGKHGLRYKPKNVADLPQRLRPRVLYCIGEDVPWSAALLCPCGCNSLIQLSLLKGERPHWTLKTDAKDAATLTPSVWRTSGCRSHFSLSMGRVVWSDEITSIDGRLE